MKYYVIKQGQYYIQEGNRVGEFYRVNELDLASEFPSIENASAFINNDMKLNLACVNIVEIEVIQIQRKLFNVNGVWYDSRDYAVCEECGEVHNRNDMQFYQAPFHDIKLLCDKCCDRIEKVEPNVFDPNSDKARLYNEC